MKQNPESYISQATAQNAVAAALFDGGTYIGSGNFGDAYEVISGGKKILVKIGTNETNQSRHGRGPKRTDTQTRNALAHEARVANELWMLGFRCIPYTVFVDGDKPALVREYGDLIKSTSAERLDKLSIELTEVVSAGWAVDDDLLVAARTHAAPEAPKGSLFIADVGLWKKQKRDADDIVGFLDLFSLLATAFGFRSRAELQFYQNWYRDVRDGVQEESPFFSLGYIRDEIAEINKSRAK